MKENEDVEYNYDVEDFLLRVIFHNLYNFGSMSSYCVPYVDCEDCIKCPSKGYQNFANLVRANCSSLMVACSWNGVPFDCCSYFKPIRTTLGTCFVLNSIQTIPTGKGSKDWLDMTVGFDQGLGNLQIEVTKSSSVIIVYNYIRNRYIKCYFSSTF